MFLTGCNSFWICWRLGSHCYRSTVICWPRCSHRSSDHFHSRVCRSRCLRWPQIRRQRISSASCWSLHHSWTSCSRKWWFNCALGGRQLISIYQFFRRLNSPALAWTQLVHLDPLLSWAHGRINGFTGSDQLLEESLPASFTGYSSKCEKVMKKPTLMTSKKLFCCAFSSIFWNLFSGVSSETFSFKDLWSFFFYEL